MSRDILIIHGFGQKEDDSLLINRFENQGFKVIYPDWFDWEEISKDSFEKKLQNIKNENNIVGVVGISFGGLVVGENIEKFKDIPVYLIASTPKFNPSKWILLIFKLPSEILETIINLIKPFAFLLSKICWNSVIENNAKLIYTIPTDKLISMLRYIKETDNTLKLKDKIFTVINGEYDLIMPSLNWNNFNILKHITPKAFHHNVVNDKVIEDIISTIIS